MEFPVDDALDLTNRFPQLASRFNLWYKARRGKLITDVAAWHRHQQLGAAAPTPLCGQALLEYYLHLLEEYF